MAEVLAEPFEERRPVLGPDERHPLQVLVMDAHETEVREQRVQGVPGALAVTGSPGLVAQVQEQAPEPSVVADECVARGRVAEVPGAEVPGDAQLEKPAVRVGKQAQARLPGRRAGSRGA